MALRGCSFLDTLPCVLLLIRTAQCRSNQFYQGIQITLPYTLSVFVVRHYSQGDEKTVGQLTGLLAGKALALRPEASA